MRTPEQLKGAMRNMAKEKKVAAQDIQPIREEDDYNNFRVSFQAIYGKMRIPMKIDITTGDRITPREIQYQYPFLFEDRSVSVMAYSLETILAEKYETIIRRNVETTRARDFYDLHLLFQIYQERAEWKLLRRATYATAQKRESLTKLEDAERIIQALKQSDSIMQLWQAYQRRNDYAIGISYEDVIESMEKFSKMIEKD